MAKIRTDVISRTVSMIGLNHFTVCMFSFISFYMYSAVVSNRMPSSSTTSMVSDWRLSRRKSAILQQMRELKGFRSSIASSSISSISCCSRNGYQGRNEYISSSSCICWASTLTSGFFTYSKWTLTSPSQYWFLWNKHCVKVSALWGPKIFARESSCSSGVQSLATRQMMYLSDLMMSL